MASSELQLVISAKDDASKVLKGVSSSVSKVGSVIGTMGKVAGTAFLAVGAAATALGVQSVRAFADSEKEMAKFNATMKTLGKVGEESKEKLLATSQAMIKLGFDDENTANTLAMFMLRTKDASKAQDLLQVSMDLSRAKSVDLDTASKMVNLTLSGNARALKAYGIELKEGQDPLKALAELQTMVAGQSTAFADTIAGKTQILSIQWGNFKEAIGGALAVTALPLLNKLTEWATSEAFTSKVTMIAEKLALLPTYFGQARDSIMSWWAVFMEKTEWARGFIVDMMIPAINLLKETFVGSWLEIQAAIEPVKPQLIALGKILGATLVVALVAVGYAITAVVVAITSFVTLIIKAVLGTIELLTLKFEAMFKKIEEVKKAWESLKDSMSKGIDAVINIFKRDKDDNGEKALGGAVTMGRATLVGENRPEVFVPSQNGNIRQLDQVGAKPLGLAQGRTSSRAVHDKLLCLASSARDTPRLPSAETLLFTRVP